MKNILNKVAGVALAAVLALGMIGCSNGSSDDPVMPPVSGMQPVSGKQTVATPAFSVASGAVNSGTEVTITCGTEGAKIYYTKDGTAPTASSTEYKAAISVTAAVTLKAIAVKDGMNNSAVASASYTISSEKTPQGFVEVTGTTITGNESWTPGSLVFVRRRTITIPDMYVCDHEVTRGEFKEVMGTDPSTASAYDKDGNKLTGDAVLNNPVNSVNWYDAIAYCNKLSLKENLTPCYSVSGVTDWENLAYSSIPTTSDTNWDAAVCDFEADGYRLPTEAEWEWLERGGENYFYAGSNTIDDVAWYEKNTSDTGTREVKTKKANGYGLYDMSGNVCEWCYDWADVRYGMSSGSNRVLRLRGGAWYDNDDSCQVPTRLCTTSPSQRNYGFGFRVVRSSSKGNSGTPVKEISSGNIPEGFVKVKGGTVVGKKNTNNYSGVFIEGRTVTLSDFYMSKYEVTKAQYKAIMEDTSLNTLKITADPSRSTLNPKRYVIAAGEEDNERPVENVTWYDAVYFCNLLSKKEGLEPVYTINNPQTSTASIPDAGASGNETVSIKYIKSATVTTDHTKNGYRLPTEAEWEYAARGGDPSAADWDYTFSGAAASGASYSSSENSGLDTVGWYGYENDAGTTGSGDVTSNASGKGTHQVGQKAPNVLGIYDMSGNVEEWCYDWYGIVSTGEETDPLGSSSGSFRVNRGGSWYYGASNASVCHRDSIPPSYISFILGFRLVRSAQLTL